MQTTLLNILIVGLLVLLFGVLYRKTATSRLRFWIAGWLFTLFHFVTLLFAATPWFWHQTQFAISNLALAMTGICFALASTTYVLWRKEHVQLAAIAGIPAVLYILLISYGITSPWLLSVVVIGGEAAVSAAGWRYKRKKAFLSWVSCAAAVLTSISMLWMVGTGHAVESVYVMLAQLFLLNALFFYVDFLRISAGVLTSVAGLLAWGTAFPLALLLGHHLPGYGSASAIWDVPKYFVAFGMILTLLEDQLLAANRQREQYRLLFDSSPHPMYIHDSHTLEFLRVNDAAIELYGYSREELLEKTLHDLQESHPMSSVDLFLANSHSELKQTGPWLQKRKDGRGFHAEISSHALEFEGREARFSMVSDVTDRQRIHEMLVHQAHHDSLTSLPNRILLEQRMRLTLENASRYNHKAAVICIDLDRFKQINDTYGHGAGDMCLQEIAKRLTCRLRESDTVARTGGEEFTIVIGELLYASDAEKVATDLLTSFQRPVQIGNLELKLSASIGVALYPEHGTEGKELWRAADLIMYRAKFAGGNKYLVAPVSEPPQILTDSASEAHRVQH